MFVHWGQKPYGKVDHVPGLFYVATRFVHVQYVPLIPIESMLVMDRPEVKGEYRDCVLRLSGKSILFAWLRAALIVGGVAMMFGGLAELGEGKNPAASLGWMLSAVGLWVMCWYSYRLSRPGVPRAIRLATEAGIPPEIVARAFVANGYRLPDEAVFERPQDQ